MKRFWIAVTWIAVTLVNFSYFGTAGAAEKCCAPSADTHNWASNTANELKETLPIFGSDTADALLGPDLGATYRNLFPEFARTVKAKFLAESVSPYEKTLNRLGESALPLDPSFAQSLNNLKTGTSFSLNTQATQNEAKRAVLNLVPNLEAVASALLIDYLKNSKADFDPEKYKLRLQSNSLGPDTYSCSIPISNGIQNSTEALVNEGIHGHCYLEQYTPSMQPTSNRDVSPEKFNINPIKTDENLQLNTASFDLKETFDPDITTFRDPKSTQSQFDQWIRTIDAKCKNGIDKLHFETRSCASVPKPTDRNKSNHQLAEERNSTIQSLVTPEKLKKSLNLDSTPTIETEDPDKYQNLVNGKPTGTCGPRPIEFQKLEKVFQDIPITHDTSCKTTTMDQDVNECLSVLHPSDHWQCVITDKPGEERTRNFKRFQKAEIFASFTCKSQSPPRNDDRVKITGPKNNPIPSDDQCEYKVQCQAYEIDGPHKKSKPPKRRTKREWPSWLPTDRGVFQKDWGAVKCTS